MLGGGVYEVKRILLAKLGSLFLVHLFDALHETSIFTLLHGILKLFHELGQIRLPLTDLMH